MAIGSRAFTYGSSGSDNICIGLYAGNFAVKTANSKNIFIGNYSGPSSTNSTNEIVIGTGTNYTPLTSML